MRGCVVQTWWIAIAIIGWSIAILATLATGSEHHEHVQHHTDVILLGATGDLAKRYLWNGFFNLYTKEFFKNSSSQMHSTFMFYACALSPGSQAEPLLAKILDSQLICVDPLLTNTCQDHVYKFKERVKYFQLQDEAQYKNLCQILNQRSCSDRLKLTQIFYLAIPPSSYTPVAERIAKHCKQSTTRGGNIKLVIEKPFGIDLKSAQNLSSVLERYFNEDEIYRIDHYLGKTTVKNILPFRSVHEDIEQMLNGEHVDSIDVVIKETDGVTCTDRTTFYNGIGVIRDMLQNHMMELLTLITMDMPGNLSNVQDIRTAKLRLLDSIHPVSIDDIALGQYSSYQQELQAALNTASQHTSGVTPTLAFAQLSIHSPRWAGVPVMFLSGKKMDSKISYVRVKFKHRKLPLTTFERNPKLDQIIFHISGAGINTPAVIVSHGLSESLFSNYQRKFADTKDPDICRLAQIYDEDCDNVIVFNFTSMYSAHSVLIDDIFHGRRGNFIDKEHLLALWEVWTPVLHEITKTNKLPVLYDVTSEQRKSKQSMYYYRTHLNTIEKFGSVQQNIYVDQLNQNIVASTADTFLGSKLTTGEADHVISSLAKHLQEQARQTIARKGSFHVAFSGGKSPVKLFTYLSQHHFPWQHSHVWMVDERCVSINNPLSNFHSLETNLLSFVNIPFTNIHPMPVDINGQLCDESSRGDVLYSQALNYWLSGTALDFVILGVGDDGHVASLFPRQPVLLSQSNVAYTEGGPENNVPKRMTLTYQSINSASYIAILMTGTSKHNVIHKLEQEKLDLNEFPVVGVHGNVTWYIDYAAYFGL